MALMAPDYWTTGIGRADLDGTGVNGPSSPPDLPLGVAVDRFGIYWTNSGSDTIGRANLDGDPSSVNQSCSPVPASPVGWRSTPPTSTQNAGPTRSGAPASAAIRAARQQAWSPASTPGGSDPTGAAGYAGPPPSNEFGVRGVKVNKKGSAKLTVKVGPGELELAKTGSVKGHARAAQSGTAKLTVKAKGKAKEEAEIARRR